MQAETSSSANPPPRRSPVYELQLQAFLDAADDVDVDEDVLEDLLDGFEGEPEPHAHDGERRLDANDAFEVEENDGLDDPEYEALVQEGSVSAPLAVDAHLTCVTRSRCSLVTTRDARDATPPEGEGCEPLLAYRTYELIAS
jgi:hypothetical protein